MNAGFGVRFVALLVPPRLPPALRLPPPLLELDPPREEPPFELEPPREEPPFELAPRPPLLPPRELPPRPPELPPRPPPPPALLLLLEPPLLPPPDFFVLAISVSPGGCEARVSVVHAASRLKVKVPESGAIGAQRRFPSGKRLRAYAFRIPHHESRPRRSLAAARPRA